MIVFFNERGRRAIDYIKTKNKFKLRTTIINSRQLDSNINKRRIEMAG